MRRLGGRFATPLGIELKQRDSAELFKWFLAAMLFGAPISHVVAARTYRELAAAGASRPQALLRIGWRGLVGILDRGGYVRYDEKTATKLLTVCQALMDGCAGDLVALEQSAEDETDLERRLMALGSGVGPVTVTIFLRELRGIWAKAEPLPCAMGIHAAYDLGYVPARINHPARILERLKEVWREAGGRASDFADFETALVRHGISLRRARHRRPSMQRTRATERRA
ncbi:MAG TPA: hypothetical protein VEK05_16480 [Burkholderiales bacterium]|nr:hypothetical protein [Burkholderiales bacterium]